MKLSISALVAKFSCFTLSAKFYDVNLLNYLVVYSNILITVIMINNFLFNFTSFCVIVSFVYEIVGIFGMSFLTNSSYTVF